MTETRDLHQEAKAAQARAERLGQEDTARALAGIAAMIAALEAEAAETAAPSEGSGDRAR